MTRLGKARLKAFLGASGVVLSLSAARGMANTITTSSVSLTNGTNTVNIYDRGQEIDGGGSDILAGTIGLQTSIGVLNA